MGRQPLPTQMARASLAECSRNVQDDLDGFPIEALLSYYLAALARGARSITHASTLVRQTLSNWTARLEKDISAFACTPTEALVAARRSLICQHDALVDLQKRLSDFEQSLTAHGECMAPRPGRQHSTGTQAHKAFRRPLFGKWKRPRPVPGAYRHQRC